MYLSNRKPHKIIWHEVEIYYKKKEGNVMEIWGQRLQKQNKEKKNHTLLLFTWLRQEHLSQWRVLSITTKNLGSSMDEDNSNSLHNGYFDCIAVNCAVTMCDIGKSIILKILQINACYLT